MAARMAVKSKPFCNHCERRFKRTELDSRFLCSDCRTISGVQGYRDPNKRGMTKYGGTGEAYFNATRAQLNVITDAEEASSVAPPRPDKQLTEFERWRADLKSSGLSSDAKLLLLELAGYGDFETGANIFASEAKLATALGWSRNRVRRELLVGRAWAKPVRLRRRGWGGESVNGYQLMRPADAPHGRWAGPLNFGKAKHLTVSDSELSTKSESPAIPA